MSDAELRLAALALARETAVEGTTTGGLLFLAEQVYRFLTGGTVVMTEGSIRVVSAEEGATRH